MNNRSRWCAALAGAARRRHVRHRQPRLEALESLIRAVRAGMDSNEEGADR